MHDFITIRLNGKIRKIQNISPTLTLLNYLRNNRALCGTKEGCAEGDCGACTVVVADIQKNAPRYRALNACILFVSMLDGKSITTVEHLKTQNGELHPVQKVLVETHGSQCGFCTPGFIMSMYAQFLSENMTEEEAAAPDILAGNLCRCTGYGPIIEAFSKIHTLSQSALEARQIKDQAKWLATYAHPRTIHLSHKNQQFFSPKSLNDLFDYFANRPNSILLAGATDIGLWVTKQHREIGSIIYLDRIGKLKKIHKTSKNLILGSGVTYTEALPVIKKFFPDLGELIRRIGAAQVRNIGTIGGNIANASPIGDMLPALISLGTTLRLRKKDKQRSIPIEDYFLSYEKQDIRPKEILETIDIPIPSKNSIFSCYKISKRFDQDISAVCGSFNIQIQDGTVADARIAFGGMASIPKRAFTVETKLKNKPLSEEIFVRAASSLAKDFTPITDMRATAGYRMKAAKNLFSKFIKETSETKKLLRLVGRGAVFDQQIYQHQTWNGHQPAKTITGGISSPQHHESSQKHVTGEAIFVDDIPTPKKTLEVFIAISNKAHAKIRRMDLDKVNKTPGVVSVLSAQDIPGINDVSPIMGDDPLFAHDLVEYAGQPLFAVAANTFETARKAASLADIDYEIIPPVLTIDQAMHEKNFLEPPKMISRGNAKLAIASAAHQLKGQLYIGGQEHFYLEGQVALAVPGEDKDVTVHCSTQHPTEIQHTVAKVLATPNHSVTVEVRRMGGGFGGKESNGNLPAAVAALAAKKTGLAAKVRFDRDQDMIVTGKRHDFRISYNVGFNKSGVIKGIIFDQAARCGRSYDLSVPICNRAMFHADNAYYLPNVRITSYRCKTNTVSNTAFRGFGGPQGMLGIERVIEKIAHYLKIDPLEVRKANFYDSHDMIGERSITPYEMRVEDSVIKKIVAELRKTACYDERRKEIFEWNQNNSVLKRGISLTPVKFGISFTLTFLNQAGALIHIYNDGSIHLNHGGTEMGQGLFTKIAQVVADAFQVDIDNIKITATNTGKVPNTSATAASAGTDLNGMAAKDACDTIKSRLKKFAAERWQKKISEVVFLPNCIRVGSQEIPFKKLINEAYRARVPLSATGFYATPKINWDKEQSAGRPFFYFAYGAAVSEVVIDTLTGENKILRADILHDTGKSINQAVDMGQIEGGYVQGAGWLTTEELWWDNNGTLKTHAPSTYKIPTCSDRPIDMRINIWNEGKNKESTIHRSKAVGEPPLMLSISVLMALADAVSASNGYTFYPDLNAPATPEQVMRAIKSIQQTTKANI